MRRTKGLRYAAMRKAQEAKQGRDAKRLRRERQVEAALAEYFEHVAVAEAVEAATAAKVAEVTAAGAAEAGRVRAAAALAVRAMLDLGESRTAVAELTGLTLSGVREMARAALGPDTTAAVMTLDAALVRAQEVAVAAPTFDREPVWSPPPFTDDDVAAARTGPPDDGADQPWPATTFDPPGTWPV